MKKLFFVVIAIFICSASFSQRYYNRTESDARYNKVADNVNPHDSIYYKEEIDLLLAKIKPVDITDSKTLELSDFGKTIKITASTAKTITIPLESVVAFPLNTVINVINLGTGDVSIAITATGTLLSESSWVKIGAQYSGVTLLKIATNTWVILGRLKA